MRERLRGQLMRALYLNGQQAEALEVYHDFRSVLRDELGLDPSPQLRELEGAILGTTQWSLRYPRGGSAPGAQARDRHLRAVAGGSDSGLPLDPEAYEVVSEQSVSALTAVLERYGGKLASQRGRTPDGRIRRYFSA